MITSLIHCIDERTVKVHLHYTGIHRTEWRDGTLELLAYINSRPVQIRALPFSSCMSHWVLTGCKKEQIQGKMQFHLLTIVSLFAVISQCSPTCKYEYRYCFNFLYVCLIIVFFVYAWKNTRRFPKTLQPLSRRKFLGLYQGPKVIHPGAIWKGILSVLLVCRSNM